MIHQHKHDDATKYIESIHMLLDVCMQVPFSQADEDDTVNGTKILKEHKFYRHSNCSADTHMATGAPDKPHNTIP